MGSAPPADTEALDTPISVYRDWFWYRYVGVAAWSNRTPKTEVAGSSRQFYIHLPKIQIDPNRSLSACVGTGTLYRHFPTRDALIEGVYRNEVEKLAAAAARFAETMSPLEALRADCCRHANARFQDLVRRPTT